MEELAKELLLRWNSKLIEPLDLSEESILLGKDELDEAYVDADDLDRMPELVLVHSFGLDDETVICVVTDELQEIIYWQGIILRGELVWSGL